MQKSSSKKQFWVIGVVIIVVVLFGSFMWWQSSQSTPSDDMSNTSPSPTISVRHDNSGAGATQDNPVQEHFDRAMQHLGL